MGVEARQETHLVRIRKDWERPCVALVFVAGAFELAVASVLVWGYAHRNISNPLDSPELSALKEHLRKEREDVAAKERFRRLDLELRRRFFAHQRRLQMGRWLLFAGGVVLVAALGALAWQRKTLPEMPRPLDMSECDEHIRSRAFLSAGVFSAVSGLAAVALLAWMPAPKPPEIKPSAVAPPPAPEELAKNWPRFRGQGGSGLVLEGEWPISWDIATGEGVLWKVEVPLKGASSPVVWGERVFITGADAARREVYCFHALTGELLWKAVISVDAVVSSEKKVWDDKTYAAATPVTDGRFVCCVFANGDVACLDMDGRQRWKRSFAPVANTYGHASSPVLWKDLLFIQLDQVREEKTKAERSRIIALDASTGRTIWERPRPVRDSWTTPIVIEAAGKEQLITLAEPWVIAYEPASGEELWRAKGPKGDLVPSPIFAGGFIIVTMELSKIFAIRPDGSQDVTNTHVVWTAEGDLPSIPSPVSDGKRLYVVSSSGILSVWELSTGQKLWEVDLEIPVQSSLTIAGGKLYIFGDEGDCIVLEAAEEHKPVARSSIGEACQTSPAFIDGRIYVRGEEHLYCFARAGSAQ